MPAKFANELGILTGGNRRGINGGCFFFLCLPESGVKADLPLIGYFPRTAQPNTGLLPDVPVNVTARDITLRQDGAMQKALALLR